MYAQFEGAPVQGGQMGMPPQGLNSIENNEIEALH